MMQNSGLLPVSDVGDYADTMLAHKSKLLFSVDSSCRLDHYRGRWPVVLTAIGRSEHGMTTRSHPQSVA